MINCSYCGVLNFVDGRCTRCGRLEIVFTLEIEIADLKAQNTKLVDKSLKFATHVKSYCDSIDIRGKIYQLSCELIAELLKEKLWNQN